MKEEWWREGEEEKSVNEIKKEEDTIKSTESNGEKRKNKEKLI